jgi:hypothetical protein
VPVPHVVLRPGLLAAPAAARPARGARAAAPHPDGLRRAALHLVPDMQALAPSEIAPLLLLRALRPRVSPSATCLRCCGDSAGARSDSRDGRRAGPSSVARALPVHIDILGGGRRQKLNRGCLAAAWVRACVCVRVRSAPLQIRSPLSVREQLHRREESLLLPLFPWRGGWSRCDCHGWHQYAAPLFFLVFPCLCRACLGK